MEGILRHQVIYCGDRETFYVFDGELYTSTFPQEYAMNHAFGTGPKHCRNCAEVGSWNGVFIGYCANCAFHAYKGQRGRGFIDIGQEDDSVEGMKFHSVFDTYMRGINLHEVGDKEILDSAGMMRRIQDCSGNAVPIAADMADSDIEAQLVCEGEEDCSEYQSFRSKGLTYVGSEKASGWKALVCVIC